MKNIDLTSKVQKRWDQADAAGTLQAEFLVIFVAAKRLSLVKKELQRHC